MEEKTFSRCLLQSKLSCSSAAFSCYIKQFLFWDVILEGDQ